MARARVILVEGLVIVAVLVVVFAMVPPVVESLPVGPLVVALDLPVVAAMFTVVAARAPAVVVRGSRSGPGGGGQDGGYRQQGLLHGALQRTGPPVARSGVGVPRLHAPAPALNAR